MRIHYYPISPCLIGCNSAAAQRNSSTRARQRHLSTNHRKRPLTRQTKSARCTRHQTTAAHSVDALPKETNTARHGGVCTEVRNFPIPVSVAILTLLNVPGSYPGTSDSTWIPDDQPTKPSFVGPLPPRTMLFFTTTPSLCIVLLRASGPPIPRSIPLCLSGVYTSGSRRDSGRILPLLLSAPTIPNTSPHHPAPFRPFWGFASPFFRSNQAPGQQAKSNHSQQLSFSLILSHTHTFSSTGFPPPKPH